MRVRPLVLLLAAACVAGVVERAELLKFWAEIYPRDAARQAALGRCYFENHNFNRFSAEARTTCYQKWIQPGSLSAEVAPRLQTPNAVDLAHAIGESTVGNMPTSDIRKELATEFYINTTH
jgi:hypothetical protein